MILKFKQAESVKLRINKRWKNFKVVEAECDDWITFEDADGLRVTLSPTIHINHIKKPAKRKVKTKKEKK